MGSMLERVAAAPISWGVCEVPGWGYQLPAARVLDEMTALGITATEFGPEGFLPGEPEPRRSVLEKHGLCAIGGFFPVVLHDPEHDPLQAVLPELDAYQAANASVLVLAAETGVDGYDQKHELDEGQWQLFAQNLERVQAAAAQRGVTVVLHPHVGTMIESGQDVRRLLENTTVSVCLDTGHLLIGGSDPRELAAQHPERIAHVHLKDVNSALAGQVQDGTQSYTEAVRAGMYVPLGQGDAGIGEIITSLETHGYRGWYVMEQDTILDGEPAGEGPVAEVRQSMDFLKRLAAELEAPARS